MEAVRNMDHENPLLIPGVQVKTGPDDSFPIETEELDRFEGETWVPFTDLISYEGKTPVPEE